MRWQPGMAALSIVGVVERGPDGGARCAEKIASAELHRAPPAVEEVHDVFMCLFLRLFRTISAK